MANDDPQASCLRHWANDHSSSSGQVALEVSVGHTRGGTQDTVGGDLERFEGRCEERRVSEGECADLGASLKGLAAEQEAEKE